ncbi:MAG: hypothetical protein ABI700_15410, partial [Chloroflexota bacterium]
QMWRKDLPGGSIWDEPDNEAVEYESKDKLTFISMDDLHRLHVDIWWENRFEVAAKMPLTWLISARQLRRSADVLHNVAEAASEEELKRFVDEMESDSGNITGTRYLSEEEEALRLDSSLASVAIMLQGLAIENLAKGVLVSRNADDLVVGGKFKRGTHDLVKLVAECKIPLTDKERNILEITAEYVSWRGRYLVPLNVDGLRPKERKWHSNFIDNLKGQDGFHRGDYEVLVSLFDRLFGVYEEERQKRHTEQDKAAQSKMTSPTEDDPTALTV